ncbi:MAG: hypothetical protein FWD71_12650 [Oscillospiraceae bacterium]|nr:hypothetical protein [Oscillospiraceae bacterium]
MSRQAKECYDGVNYTTITALFRAYDSIEAGVADYFALLSGCGQVQKSHRRDGLQSGVQEMRTAMPPRRTILLCLST